MNKKTLLVLCSLLFSTFFLNAQGDATSDQEAIRQVIESETAAIQNCDFEAFSDHWWHEDHCYFSVTSPSFHWSFHGWDEISKWAREQVANCDPANASGSKKYDYKYTINGDMAFVTFLEDAGNESTRVLEKRDGQWKLIRMGVVTTVAYEAMEKAAKKEEQLARFSGKWQGNLSTFTVTPPATDWEILGFQFENEATPTGMRLNHQRQWENAAGTWEYTRRMELAGGSGSEEMGLLVAGHNSEGWSHYNYGSAELTEDGMLVQRTKRTNQDQLQETAWLSIKENGKLNLKVEVYDEEGKVETTFSIDMDRQ